MPYTEDGVGYRNTDTSQAAALPTAPKRIIRARVMGYMRTHPKPLSAHDIAEALRLDILTVRPRLTELRTKGHIKDTGLRGKTPMGKSCVLWQAN